jgi:Fe-S cluster assembly iron-binding protein IscA
MVFVTSVAVEKIKAVKAAQGTPEEAGLRVRVVGGGCSGFRS